MTQAGFEFEVTNPPLDEPDRMGPTVPAAHQAEALAYFKARTVARRLKEGIVIGADTVVACEGEVYHKPGDMYEARLMLGALVGRRQEVITGIALINAATGARLISHDSTVVVMRDLAEQVIEDYLATGEWEGKAGAYGIQDQGDTFVERIEGSFTNVVGLPVEKLTEMLRAFGGVVPTNQATGAALKAPGS
jgi:septum formation protein